MHTGALTNGDRFRVKHIGTGYWAQLVFPPDESYNIWSSDLNLTPAQRYSYNGDYTDHDIGWIDGSCYEFKSTDHGIGAIFKYENSKLTSITYDNVYLKSLNQTVGLGWYSTNSHTVTESSITGKYNIFIDNNLCTVYALPNDQISPIPRTWIAQRTSSYSNNMTNHILDSNLWELWKLPDADQTDIDK